MIKVNTDFLIIAYIIGLFIDWVFQADWQAVNKCKIKLEKCIFSKWYSINKKSISALTTHSFIYSILTAFISLLLINKLYLFIPVFIILFITHVLIDTRILVKKIMLLKGMPESSLTDSVNYGFMHIGIDHRLHELVILIISIFVV